MHSYGFLSNYLSSSPLVHSSEESNMNVMHRQARKRLTAYDNPIASLESDHESQNIPFIPLKTINANTVEVVDANDIDAHIVHSYSNLIYETLSYDFHRPSQTSIIGEHLRHLRQKFSERTDAIKEFIHQPPDYENDSGDAVKSGQKEDQPGSSPSALILSSDSESRASTAASLPTEIVSRRERIRRCIRYCILKSGFRNPIDTDSKMHLTWLLFVAMAYLYNFISVPLRIAFSVWTEGSKYTWIWMLIDYSCDGLYLIDMFFVQTRIKYLENGLWVTNFRLTAMKYIRSVRFGIDCLSILPLDLFYLIFGKQAIFRLPRLLKLRSLTDFFRYCDRWVQTFFASVRLIRILALLLYVVLSVHVYACFYFLFSNYERRHGVDNGWVYKIENQPRMSAYSYSFYYCFKIASTIGNIPSPETGLEYVFVITGYLFALFIFALLIGQIRDVFQSMNRRRSNYQNQVEQVMEYLKKFGIPISVQNRVRNWFQYNWEDRNTLEDDDAILSFLPTTLQTELAISIHYETLSKVQLFQDCEKAFLYSLVLKLKPTLFLPGDYVCKKGEIGREMYIVNHGILDVYIDGKRITGLEDGAVFGEISLLEVAGGNRRTADVISRGFSTLFTLHKADLNDQLKDFPEVGKILRRKAKKLVKRSSKPDEEDTRRNDTIVIAEPIIIDHMPKTDPKLLDTVLMAVGTNSKLAEVLTKPRMSVHRGSFISETFDKSKADESEANQTQISIEHSQTLTVPQVTVNSVNTSPSRIQALRQRLFSAPFQNLPSAMHHSFEDDDGDVDDQENLRRLIPSSETKFTLLFDDDLV